MEKLIKRVKSHTFRHSFATHLLQADCDIRTIQTMPAHTDVRTTMMYTHCVPGKTAKEAKIPLDFKHHFTVEYNKLGMFFAFIVNNTIECISWTIPSS
ncbi:MAG: tyrosine-type recombinase/integrase [Desulfobulbus sp.]|nr:tyrosine-type recombinase/integrase [Desulfobulbus sp.]